MQVSYIGKRITCVDVQTNLTVSISTPKRFVILALAFTIGSVWASVGIYAALTTGPGQDPSSGACAIGGGLIFFYIWLWNAMGKEIISVNATQLSIRRSIWGLGWSQKYALSEVTNLRVAIIEHPLFSFERNQKEWGFAGGSIAFDYKGYIYRFGLLLSPEDATELISQITKHCQAL